MPWAIVFRAFSPDDQPVILQRLAQGSSEAQGAAAFRARVRSPVCRSRHSRNYDIKYRLGRDTEEAE